MVNYDCLQEFYDEWPIKLGEVEPYKGPKTPDGRVNANIFFSAVWVRCQETEVQEERNFTGTLPSTVLHGRVDLNISLNSWFPFPQTPNLAGGSAVLRMRQASEPLAQSCLFCFVF